MNLEYVLYLNLVGFANGSDIGESEKGVKNDSLRRIVA